MECYVTKTYLKVLSRGRPTLSFLEKYDFVILWSSIEDIYILSLFFLYFFFFLKLIRKEDVRGGSCDPRATSRGGLRGEQLWAKKGASQVRD